MIATSNIANIASWATVVVVLCALWILLAIRVGKDAQRRGRNGWVWGFLLIFNPVIFGVAYLVVRNRDPEAVYPTWVPDQLVNQTSIYRLYKWWPLQIKVTTGAFAALAVFLVWNSAVGATGPGWVFTTLWVVGVCYVGYGLLWRMAYELELKDDVLHWKTPLRSGSVHLNDVRAMHPWSWSPNAEAIDLENGKRLLVMVQKGFNAFTDDVASRAPRLPITVSRFADIADRWPGARSGYKRRD